MKKTIIRYGLYAGLMLAVLGMLQLLVSKTTSYEIQEIYGYLTIFLSMIFVVIGMRHYRDRINGGELTFGQGMKVGLGIVLIPSVLFGLFDILYTKVMNPSWQKDYAEQYISNLKKTVSPDKLEAAIKKFNSSMEMFSNPFYEFLLMAATVFLLGLVVTIIASITLRRKKTISAA